MPRKRRPLTADDTALRRSYLEMYAARDVRKRLSRINFAIGVRHETVDRWLRDQDFVAEMHAIDQRRMEAASMLAQTLWPRIVEELATMAAGMPEEPPDVAERSQQEIRFLLAAYSARAAKRVTMSVRAAELVAKIVGAIKERPTVAVYTDNVEQFGSLPDNTEGLLAERARLEGVLQRARERQAAKIGNGAKG